MKLRNSFETNLFIYKHFLFSFYTLFFGCFFLLTKNKTNNKKGIKKKKKTKKKRKTKKKKGLLKQKKKAETKIKQKRRDYVMKRDTTFVSLSYHFFFVFFVFKERVLVVHLFVNKKKSMFFTKKNYLQFKEQKNETV